MTCDQKSKKFELFEDLFHTMIKMQPAATSAGHISEKYVKPESQATAKRKWHMLTFDPAAMKLPDFLEELNQGAEKAFGENAKQ